MERSIVRDKEFPWSGIGLGPEPRMPSDFAARVFEKARTTRSRKRRTRIALGMTAGLAALLAIALSIRPNPANQPTMARDLHTTSNPTTDYADENTDLLAIMMPDAVPAAKFDAYYGAGWDTYASADPTIYDGYR
jgi:hypothetical protein